MHNQKMNRIVVGSLWVFPGWNSWTLLVNLLPCSTAYRLWNVIDCCFAVGNLADYFTIA